MTGAFSPDYDTARSRFLVAARARGAELASIPIAAPGPSGTPLTIDSATLGPRDAPRKVVVSSGLHGVEGFAGSAIQLAWLERPSRPPAPDVAIVLVHALNPYGFAWIRRTNERNVDLNRNFFSDRSFLGSDDVRRAEAIYRRFSPFLNPTSTPSRWEPYTLRALLAIARHGRRALERALPVGQYIEARGLFFGGHDTETTTAVVRREATRWCDGASVIVHLDIHTGLGGFGQLQLLVNDPPGTPEARWLTQCFGAAVTLADQRRTYRAHGTMTDDLRARLAPCVYHGITAEFGTFSGLRVLGALRAENRAHFHGMPEDPMRSRPKQQLLETFAPASAHWRRRVVDSGTHLIDQSIDAVTRWSV